MKNNFSIRKRDGSIVPFDIDKIANAIYRAMIAVNKGEKESSKNIAKKVFKKIEIIEKEKRKNVNIPYKNITVEEIQDIVEKELMANSFYDVAKSYIIYREKRAILRKRDIFKKRINLKPYEYPELYEYVNAIRHSYWIHTEFNYLSDIQDFKANITEKERSAIKKTMLAIAQIEVAVKSFWGDIYKKMPKPEIASVGFTFAESEVRHMDAYSHLLEILGLNEEFTKIEEVPVLMERIKYLENSIKTSKSEDNKEITKAILLFSLFIEHVSLFSQFLIIMSFNKYKNLFKGISNAVEATSKEEQIHGLFGIEIINIIKKEHPDWFDDNFKKTIIESCKNSLDTEKKVVDWIFKKGELEFLSKDIIMEFVKNRLNNSLVSIGVERIFKVNEKMLQKTEWFDEEIITTKHGDFFVKRSINYNKRSKSITGEDLF
ncbi:MAG: ribonucleotide-diphosphate reductase subunit beta [Candidatus Pacebacteria bacterium]|nr:ribonucleotide-diphosphate reductase subunit beta [Candidatus Paceibacterota bacterium]